MQNDVYRGDLTPSSIDATSEKLAELLEEMKLTSKDIMRYRLTVEEVMGIWGEELGENSHCTLVKKQRFGKTTLLLRAEGKAVDPTKYRDDTLLSVANNPNIAAALGLPAEYIYTGGRNELKLCLPKKQANASVNVLIAMACAILLGLVLRLILPDFSVLLSEQIILPVMNTITNLLRLIAGPLVFLSIVAGITGIGDASSFGKIGGTLVKRFFLMTFICTLVIWLSLCWLNPPALSGYSGEDSGFSKILQMILDIVPADGITPFQAGNAMQIIFIAASVGVGMIMLGDTVVETISVLNQINAIIQLLMSGISRILPGFVFLCILNLIVSSNNGAVSQIVVPLVIINALCLIFPVLYGLYASIVTRMPFISLLRKQFPTFLMSLSTASSAATFGTNVECCEKELGIDARLTRFGVPFGQVLFMPGACIIYSVMALYMAHCYDVAVSPAWIVTLVIVVTIVAMASPPIPGGALSSILVIYTQLGLPVESIAITATIITFSDYAATACNLTCLQQELLITAKKMGLIKQN